MKKNTLAAKIIDVPETASTNKLLRELLVNEKLPEFSLIKTGFQTAGRGQLGNSWESAKGENLTFSLVIYPEFLPANRQFLISEVTALSIKQMLDEFTENITVKWPNDIYFEDNKICGMLIENDLLGDKLCRSIIGIGLNINQKRFISNAPNPISLHQITGNTYSLDKLLDRFIELFRNDYQSIKDGKHDTVETAYMNSLYRKDGFHTFKDKEGEFKASIFGIEPTGHLILKLSSKEIRRYAFKEVSFVQEED